MMEFPDDQRRNLSNLTDLFHPTFVRAESNRASRSMSQQSQDSLTVSNRDQLISDMLAYHTTSDDDLCAECGTKCSGQCIFYDESSFSDLQKAWGSAQPKRTMEWLSGSAVLPTQKSPASPLVRPLSSILMHPSYPYYNPQRDGDTPTKQLSCLSDSILESDSSDMLSSVQENKERTSQASSGISSNASSLDSSPAPGSRISWFRYMSEFRWYGKSSKSYQKVKDQVSAAL